MVECEVFEEEIGVFNLFIGLCGTNLNAERCCEHFNDSYATYFANYSAHGVCEREAELLQEVAHETRAAAFGHLPRVDYHRR